MENKLVFISFYKSCFRIVEMSVMKISSQFSSTISDLFAFPPPSPTDVISRQQAIGLSKAPIKLLIEEVWVQQIKVLVQQVFAQQSAKKSCVYAATTIAFEPLCDLLISSDKEKNTFPNSGIQFKLHRDQKKRGDGALSREKASENC
jgi:hypothetical protein